MRIEHDPWPRDAERAEQIQLTLRELIVPDGEVTGVRTVAGLDVSYDPDSARVVAAAVVLALPELTVLEAVTVPGEVTFPYVTGLLAFRELPTLVEALRRLTITPDVLVCDGYGIAHPRRFGLACHVGVLTGLPTFGVAKTPPPLARPDESASNFAAPGPARGAWSPLVEDGQVLGRALRTREGVKPVFVSVGHRIGLDAATDLTLALCRGFRLPETTRQADHLSRRVLGGAYATDRP